MFFPPSSLPKKVFRFTRLFSFSPYTFRGTSYLLSFAVPKLPKQADIIGAPLRDTPYAEQNMADLIAGGRGTLQLFRYVETPFGTMILWR
jgi:hypothetical protein